METVMVKALEAVCAAASSTWIVEVNWPAVVGVPEMTPPEDSVRPVGNWPLTIDHEYGAVPPVACSVAL